jgi:enoyl-CoA hydratase/carnithine racemase
MGELSTSILDVDTVDTAIARLRLRRPDRRNALSIRLRDDMSNALDAIARDESISVVVITGTGPVFSAGFDLGEFDDPDVQDELWASSDRWHATLRNFPLPLIAALNGPALAGGFDLAMMCDLRIAATSTYLARPEVEWSTPIYSIVRDLVGGALARELAFTNRRIEADEAMSLGLVNRVVDDDGLDAATLDLARQVCRAPRSGLMRTKSAAIAAAKVGTDAEFIW